MPLGGGQLQASCRGHAGARHLADDGRQCPAAQAVLGERQHLGILPRFRIKEAVRRKASLLEPGCIEIEPGDGPKHRAGCASEAGRQARREQGGGAIVAQCRGRRRDLVKRVGIEPLVGEPVVEPGDSERKRRPTARLGGGNLSAQGCDLLARRMCGQHEGIRLRCSLYVPIPRIFVNGVHGLILDGPGQLSHDGNEAGRLGMC